MLGFLLCNTIPFIFKIKYAPLKTICGSIPCQNCCGSMGSCIVTINRFLKKATIILILYLLDNHIEIEKFFILLCHDSFPVRVSDMSYHINSFGSSRRAISGIFSAIIIMVT